MNADDIAGGVVRDPARRLAAEAGGTMVLLMAVVGSGIATSVDGAASTQLFQHAAVVGVVLTVLIWTLAPVSDAHFNPAVTLVAVITGAMSKRLAAAYGVAQIAGAVIGAVAANVMFDQPAAALGTIARTGGHLWASELVATAGLVVVIFGLVTAGRDDTVAPAVGAWVGGAIFFTSSMSFANPAVSIARMFTDTWTGIVPAHVPAYVAAQFVGAVLAIWLTTWLFRPTPDSNPVGSLAPTPPTQEPHHGHAGSRRSQPAQDDRHHPQPRVQGNIRR